MFVHDEKTTQKQICAYGTCRHYGITYVHTYKPSGIHIVQVYIYMYTCICLTHIHTLHNAIHLNSLQFMKSSKTLNLISENSSH